MSPSYPISMAELFYNTKINAGVSIFFMMAIVWVGICDCGYRSNSSIVGPGVYLAAGAHADHFIRDVSQVGSPQRRAW